MHSSTSERRKFALSVVMVMIALGLVGALGAGWAADSSGKEAWDVLVAAGQTFVGVGGTIGMFATVYYLITRP